MKIIEGTIASPIGFYADGKHCGLKKKRKDIGVIYSEVPAQAAAVFTTNKIEAAPVTLTKQAVKDGVLQAVIVNSGNANACTGKKGLEDAIEMQQITAKKFSIKTNDVAVASTGIIGQPMEMDIIEKGIDLLEKEGNRFGFHEAILTTDTGTKELTIQAELAGKKVTMSGVCKGSGMIHPNMATMLAFITTDAAISHHLLQELLKEKTDKTFNQITIDGDTSTNDMVIVMANGAAGNPIIEKGTEAYDLFSEMLHLMMETLAKLIAKDGEGATKLIEVNVLNAQNALDARMIAKKVVGSSLVKTAIFGKDPNWGRIICAVGYSDVEINPNTIDILLGAIPVLVESQPQLFDSVAMEKVLAENEIKIMINLKQGVASGTAWGCDLSYKYVEINALYHT